MNEINFEQLLRMKMLARERLKEQRRFDSEFVELQVDILKLERKVAEKRGEAFAVEWAIDDVWNGMAYAPLVFGGAFSCVVVFKTRENRHAAFLFSEADGYKLSNIGDEVIEGHPLNGRGLSAYKSFLVENSQWLLALESIDRVHISHDPHHWRTSRHYLLCFKDRMFEAVAQDAEVIGVFESLEEATQAAMAKVK